MAKPRIVLLLGGCLSITFFAVRTQSETNDPNKAGKSTDSEDPRNMTEEKRIEESKKFFESLRNMTPDQRIRAIKRRDGELDKIRRQEKSEYFEELAEEGRGPLASSAQREKRRADRRESNAEFIAELLMQKNALGVTEERWKLIKPKLERIRRLHELTESTVRISPTGGPSDKMTGGRARAGVRTEAFEWWLPWKNKSGAERTEVRRLAEQLVALLERKNTSPQAFRVKMDALRKAKAEEAELKALELSEVRKELRELLTIRQQAALALMWGWL